MARPRKRPLILRSKNEVSHSSKSTMLSKTLTKSVSPSSHSRSLIEKIFTDQRRRYDNRSYEWITFVDTVDSKEEVRLVSRTLRSLGDELDLDNQFQKLLRQLVASCQSPAVLARDVAMEIFVDGLFNWGRIMTFVYFSYRILIQNIDKASPTTKAILSIIRLPFIYSLTILSRIIKWIVRIVAELEDNEDLKTLATVVVSCLIAMLIVANISSDKPLQ